MTGAVTNDLPVGNKAGGKTDGADAAPWLAHIPRTCGTDTPRATALRARSGAAFAKLAWPHQKDEAWQNTPLARLREATWGPARAPDGAMAGVEAWLAAHPWRGSQVVFVNGTQVRTLVCDGDKAAQALQIDSLARALSRQSGAVPGVLSAEATQPFAALNGAWLQDGAVLTVPADKAVAAPVRLLFLTVAQQGAWTTHPRVVVDVQSRAKVTVFEHHVSLDGASERHLVNGVTECHVADNATLDYTILQDADKGALQMNQWSAKVADDGTARCAAVHVGSALTRQEMRVALAGVRADCGLTGLNLARDDQHMDTQVTVDHQTTHGTSAQLFKSLLDGRATSVFSGRVLVQPHAVKTAARQMSRNVLLSKQATAYTRPQLEILADDVRCTHGATVGQLQDEAVFYLRSRGIDEATTRRLLTYAHACEALAQIRDPFIHALCDARVRLELALEAGASTLGENP